MDLPSRLSTSLFEFVLGGLLSIVALGAVFWSFMPDDAAALRNRVGDLLEHGTSATMTVSVVVAIALALGIVFESLSRVAFEWRMDRVKEKRLATFHDESRLLSSERDRPWSSAMRSVLSSHGAMRFLVLMENRSLYGEIESQILRMRVARMLAVCELFVLVAAARELLRNPSYVVALACLLLALLLPVTIKTVLAEFDRYCRAIERSCTVLLLPEVTRGLLRSESGR